MASPCMHDSVWLQQHKYEDAEAFYQKVQAGTQSIKGAPATDMPKVPANVNDAQAESSRSNDHKKTETSSIKNEIAQARQHIQNVLRSGGSGGAASVAAAGAGGDATKRIENLEKENQDLRKAVDDMKALVSKLEGRVGCLESCSGSGSAAASAPAKPPAQVTPPAAAAADDDDDDFDMFGSDDEDTKAEQEKLKEERLKAYHEKKAKKPTVVAKSSVILDVKPYDDETDMLEVEKKVRSIKIDGLLWAASKLVPMAYGIRKLQIGIVIEDDKISVDDLIDKITEDYEEEVQSVDIAAFNKL